MNEIEAEYLCISCIGDNSIKIINAETGTVVESIKMAERPFDIKVIGENKIYVACDESDRIEIIDLLTYKKESLILPNNGVMDLDAENNCIYISDGMSISVYDLESKTKVVSADGCLGVENIYVEKQGQRLFAIDFLLNQLNIYMKNSLELVRVISNLGLKPKNLLVSEASEYLFIANEGAGKESQGAGVTIVDLRNYTIKLLEFPKGSAISSLASMGNVLYAANKGLNRIEMINIVTKQLFKSINISIKTPEQLELNNEKTKLYIMGKDKCENEIIDVLDLNSCKETKVIAISDKNVIPKCMKRVSISKGYLAKDFLCLSKSSNCDLRPLSVLVKRVYASYTQKMCIPEVIYEIRNAEYEYSFQNIVFKNGYIVEGSFEKCTLKHKRDFSRVQFMLRIPYSISLKNADGKFGVFNGYIDEKKDLIMYMPEALEENDYEILIKSKGELLNSPKIHKDYIKFSVGFFLFIRVVGNQEIQLPVYNCDSKPVECEEYVAQDDEELFEAFLNFNDTPFPLNLFSIPLEDID